PLAFWFTRAIFRGFRPELRAVSLRLRLRASHRMALDDPGNDVHRLFFFIWNDFKAIAGQPHGAFGALENESALSRRRGGGGAFTNLDQRLEVLVFDNRVLDVRDLA